MFDLHTHTTYCDGKNSAEEMILAAIDKGLDTIGISGHSYTWFDESYCMSREGTERYIAEVTELKDRYADRITVLLGIERDYFAEISNDPFDYVIGSCHYMLADGKYLDVDASGEMLRSVIDAHFGGDPSAAAECYYAQVGDMIRRTDCDIIGHFDLITKFNEKPSAGEPGFTTGNNLQEDGSSAGAPVMASCEASSEAVSSDGGLRQAPIIDTSDPRYIAAWKNAVDRIFEDAEARWKSGCINRLETLGLIKAGSKPVFEINTGAMAKGYRTGPYPAPDQIEYICSKGGILIKNSDSHSTDTIAYHFTEI